MKRLVIAAGLTATLAACASPPPPPRPLPVVSRAPSYTPLPPPPPRDTCGAVDLQRLVGQPRTEIPVPVYPGARRVTCTTCPVTMDYSPGRLNILYDAETGIIREVKCG